MAGQPRTSRGPWVTVVGLGAIIVLAAAAESIKATLEQRRLTERVLHDYATEAANRLATAYDFMSGQGLVTALAPVLFHPEASASNGATMLRLLELSASSVAPCRGQEVDSLRLYFRFTPGDRRLEARGRKLQAAASQVLADSFKSRASALREGE